MIWISTRSYRMAMWTRMSDHGYNNTEIDRSEAKDWNDELVSQRCESNEQGMIMKMG